MTRKVSFNANQLKLLAIVAMLVDHIAWTFVPTESVTAFLMHTFGRLTAPIMCFFIAEGYCHTRNLGKYVMRLAVFSVISSWAYSFYESGGTMQFYGFGMIYTLFLGLLAIHVWNQREWLTGIRILLIGILCICSLLGDWPMVGVLWPLFFYIYRDDAKKKFTSFSIVGALEASTFVVMFWGNWGMVLAMLCQFAVLLAVPILKCYNGELGKHRGMKWLFYIFYPLHLIILGLISLMFV